MLSIAAALASASATVFLGFWMGPLFFLIAVCMVAFLFYWRDLKMRARVAQEAAERSIVFQGQVSSERHKPCICSWPGKYETETAWEDLAQRSRDGEITAAVVFLPDGSTNFGNHQASSADENAQCWCVDLYIERKPWRCYWRHLWISNIEKAVRNGALLNVYLFRRLAGNRQGFCM